MGAGGSPGKVARNCAGRARARRAQKAKERAQRRGPGTVLIGAEWRRHPGRGRPARFGPTEPSAVASPGFGWGTGVAAPRPLGTQRGRGSGRAARRGGLGGERGG